MWGESGSQEGKRGWMSVGKQSSGSHSSTAKFHQPIQQQQSKVPRESDFPPLEVLPEKGAKK